MLLNTNLILIKGIVATYLNGKLNTPLINVDHAIDEAISVGVAKSQILGDAGEGEVVDALENTIYWLRESTNKVKLTVDDVISTVKINVGFETDYVNFVTQALNETIKEGDDVDNSNTIKNILNELLYYTKKKKIKKRLLAAAREVEYENTDEKLNDYARRLITEIEGETATTEAKPAGYVGELDTDNLESVEKTLQNTKDLNSDEGSLTIPLVGLHEGLGKIDVRRGDMVCVKARSNNYKSGFLLDLTKWLPVYNKPYLFNKNLKPLILRISFENTPEQDALTLYKSYYEEKYQKKLDMTKTDPKKAAKEIVKIFTQQGFRVAIVCFDPNKFTVWKLIDVLTKYELDGYEIHACICDYLEIIAKATKGQRPDTAITDGFEIVRNHCMPKRITFFTAHQLNTASGDVLAEVGSAAFPKKMAQAGGIYDHNCRSLIQKLDIEINLHIHKQDDVSYLGFGVGKLRERIAPESKKYFFYKFQKYGGIIADKDGENNAIYSLISIANKGEDNNSGW